MITYRHCQGPLFFVSSPASSSGHSKYLIWAEIVIRVLLTSAAGR